MSAGSACRVEMYKPLFRISEFLLEPTRELNSFHRNVVHLYSSFEFEIQVVLIFFYIESQARNSLTLCSPPMLLPLRYCLLHPSQSSFLQRHYHSHLKPCLSFGLSALFRAEGALCYPMLWGLRLCMSTRRASLYGM